MSNLRLVGPDNPSDDDAIIKKKDIYTKSESDSKYFNKEDGIPPAQPQELGGVMLPPETWDYDPDLLYHEFAKVVGPAHDPHIPFVRNLIKAFLEWGSQVFDSTIEDDQDQWSTAHWRVKWDGLDDEIKNKIEGGGQQYWNSEMLMYSHETDIMPGFGEVPGGIRVDRDVILDQVHVRVPLYDDAVYGWSLEMEIIKGSSNSLGSAISEITIPLGQNNATVNFPGGIFLEEGSVLRGYVFNPGLTRGLHVHFRGVYA